MTTVHLRPKALAYAQQVQALLELSSLDDALNALVNSVAPDLLQRLSGQGQDVAQINNYPRLSVVPSSIASAYDGADPCPSPNSARSHRQSDPDPVLHHLAAVLPDDDF